MTSGSVSVTYGMRRPQRLLRPPICSRMRQIGPAMATCGNMETPKRPPSIQVFPGSGNRDSA